MSEFNKLVVYQRILPIVSILFFSYVLFLLYGYLSEKLSKTELKKISIIFFVALLLRFFGSSIMTFPEYMYTAIGNVVAETGRYGMCFGEFYCFPAYKPYTIYTSFLGLLFKFFENNLLVARSLNVLFGALTVFPLAALEKNITGKLRYITPFFVVFFPLHISISASMESYSFAVFFMSASLALIYDDESRTVTAFMVTLAAFMSKPYAFVLFIPLISRIFQRPEIFRKNWKGTGLFLLFSSVFFPIYYLFVFLQDSYAPGVMGTSLFRAFRIFGGIPANIPFIILGLIGFFYGFMDKDLRKYSAIFLVLALSLIIHNTNRYLIWIPFLFFTLVESGVLLSKLMDERFTKVGFSTIIMVLFAGSMLIFPFYQEQSYRFTSEDSLERTVEEYGSEGKVISDRADLLNSVSDVEVLNLELYRVEEEYSKVFFFSGAECEKVEFNGRETYELGDEEKIDSKYRFCSFEKGRG